jgi:phospholipase/carboxylesterase
MPETSERRMVQEFPCYYDLYVPDGAWPKPLVLALHGYGGDKSSMLKLMRRINETAYVIAALQGPHQHLVMPTQEHPKLGYGFGWLSNFKPEESIALHHRLVRQVIADQAAAGTIDPARVFLLGFSQACGVNFRFAFTQPELIRGVVAICGGIPGDWESAGKYASGAVDVLYVAGERDEFYTPERIRQNAAALQARARSVELRMFEAGHEVPRAAYAVIDEWLKRKTSD